MNEYQTRARATDQNPEITWPKEGPKGEPNKDNIISLLGLVGEVGGLLSEYKKMLRDGIYHEEFSQRIEEELGDILWYVATVATKFGLDLNQIAKKNLEKSENRWHEPGKKRPLYDKELSPRQQLPRQFSYKFSHTNVDGEDRLEITDAKTGAPIGDKLRDNAYEDDGYRFHDVLHFAFAAHLGWSPVWRKLLVKASILDKRSPPEVDNAEDGGRPQVIEEGIVHAAYVYADQHNFMKGVTAVDWQLLRHIKQMTSKLEVKDSSNWEWNNAILEGFKVWRKLRKHNGGIVTGDLDAKTLTFTEIK